MPILGIDLGTTNSLVSVHRDGRVQCIPNALGHDMTPSVVGLDEDGSILVGNSAKERLITHPHKTAAVFKRMMGTDQIVSLGGRPFRAEELSSLVLRSLKADAEAHLGESVRDVVISVPAYFNENQRQATRNAALLAGLNPLRLINEPTAASIAYATERIDQEGAFLVLDLGGGTFDVTILELFERTLEVRATSGDARLGGEDFTQALADLLLAENGLARESLDARDQALLHRASEAAKRELATADASLVELRLQGRDIAWPVARATFEAACESLWRRIVTPIERALSDANLDPGDFAEILVVGGATRMPRMREIARNLFGKEPRAEIDPDRVIAIGAGVQAALVGSDKAYADVVLTDVCPWTLGIEIAEEIERGRHSNGHFKPLIERNRTVPTSMVEVFHPVHPKQRSCELNIYQGESRKVANNILLGRMLVDLPPSKEGLDLIEVRFTYTIDGILEVEAKPRGSDKTHRLVIQQNPGRLSPREIEERLAELAHLKLAPRERAEFRELLARLDGHFSDSIGDRRRRIGEIMSTFEASLDSGEHSRYRPMAVRVRALLDRLDDKGDSSGPEEADWGVGEES